jgi:hypothetical protein
VKTLHIKFRGLTISRPEYRPAFVVDFEHVMLSTLKGKAENLLENTSYVAHEVNWVIVNYNQPRAVENLPIADLGII